MMKRGFRGSWMVRSVFVAVLGFLAAGVAAQVTDIAVVREDLNGDTLPDHMGQSFTIQGWINSPMYTPTRIDFFMEDATGGININTTPGDWTLPEGLQIGVEVLVSGVVTQYRGKAELDPTFLPDNIEVVDPSPATLTPATVTIAEILADPESYEGTLVRVTNAWITAGTFPCEGFNWNLTLDDGTTNITLRVDADTDIDGQPTYTTAIDVVGIVSQYDSSEPYDSGYQILPRAYDDFTQVGAGNNAPTVDCFETDPLLVEVGSTGTVVVVALDADPLDVVDLVATNLPANAEFVDNGDRTGVLTFAPDATQFGQSWTVTIIADDGTDTGSRDLVLEAQAEDSPYRGLFVLNEIMADPTGFDSNGDGVFNTSQDEYAEIVYTGEAPIDVSGFDLHDDYSSRHVVPAGTSLVPGQALLVFGGGTPTGTFGGSVVQTASSGMLGFGNYGDTITLFDDQGRLILTVTYGAEGGDDQSLTLDPDVTGPDYVKHTLATGSGGAPGSPGTRIDGSHFTSNQPPVINEIGDKVVEVGAVLEFTVSVSEPDGDPVAFTRPQPADLPPNASFTDNGDGTGLFSMTPDAGQEGESYQVVFRAEDKDGFDEKTITIDVLAADAYGVLVLNEILYDPHPDDPPAVPNGDANGDGDRQGSQDEFIEIVNTGDSSLDISGLIIRDAVAVRHVFPAGTILAPGQAVVVFGGGTPTGDFGGSVVQTASTGFLGLNNTGDTVTLLKPDDTTVIAQYSYDGSVADQSITLDPDLSGAEFVAHTTAAGDPNSVHSPGTKIDGTPFTAAPAPGEIVGIEAVSATMIRLTWTSTEGAVYSVDRSAGLVEPVWTVVASGIASGGATTSYDVPIDGMGAAFYRVGRSD